MNLLAWWKQSVDVGQTLLQSVTGLLTTLAAALVAVGVVITAARGLVRKVRKSKRATGDARRSGRGRSDSLASDMKENTGSLHTSSAASGGDSAHLAPKVPARVSTPEVVFVTEYAVEFPLWAPTQRTLTAISRILASAYKISQASYLQPRSQKPYAKQLAFLSAYAEACGDFATELSVLSGSLTSLEVPWDGGDPVATLLACIDPFASAQDSRSPDGIERVCRAEAERIAKTLERLGYPVVREQVRFDPRRPPTYKLVKPV